MIPDEVFIVDFISSVINDIKDTKSLSSIDDNGDGIFTINTSDTGRLKNYYYVTIDGIAYEVTDVVKDISFKVTSTTAPIGEDKVWITKVNYFYGTPIAIYNDLVNTDYKEKEPLIVLFEPFDENISTDEDDNTYISTSLWMALVKPYDDDWLTSDHYTRAIKPMTYLFRDMLEVLKKKEGADIVNIGTFKRTNHAKYGLWNKNKGHTQQILEKVSGIDITNLDINLSKKYSC